MKNKIISKKNVYYIAVISTILLIAIITAVLFSLNILLPGTSFPVAIFPLIILTIVIVLSFLFVDKIVDKDEGVVDGNKFVLPKKTEDEKGTLVVAKEESKTKSLTIHWIALVTAIVLMGFSQSILSAAHLIGQAPIDAMSLAFSEMINSSYSVVNYFFVALIVISGIIFTRGKKEKIVASTAFITGLSLALFVRLLSVGVVIHMPEIYYPNGSGGNMDIGEHVNGGIRILIATSYFVLGYVLLLLSIGIWLNVGFGLRPYELLLTSLNKRFEKISYVFWRNSMDLSWVIFALIFAGIATAEGGKFTDHNAIGVGTIIFVLITGYLTNYSKIIFGKIIK